MTAFNLTEHLIQQKKAKRLGHFYILESRAPEHHKREHLNRWMEDFLSSVIKDEAGLASIDAGRTILKQGVPDILIFRKSDEEIQAGGKYVMSDDIVATIQGEQHFGNFSYSWRFIVVYDAHLLGPVICNKLLKVLEEPQKFTSLIFLCPSTKGLLPTVHSRAQTLFVPWTPSPEIKSTSIDNRLRQRSEQKELFSELLLQSQQHNPTLWSEDKKLLALEFIQGKISELEFIEGLRHAPDVQLGLFQLALDVERMTHSSLQEKEQWLKDIQWFNQSKTFNNDFKERLYALLRNLQFSVVQK